MSSALLGISCCLDAVTSCELLQWLLIAPRHFLWLGFWYYLGPCGIEYASLLFVAVTYCATPKSLNCRNWIMQYHCLPTYETSRSKKYFKIALELYWLILNFFWEFNLKVKLYLRTRARFQMLQDLWNKDILLNHFYGITRLCFIKANSSESYCHFTNLGKKVWASLSIEDDNHFSHLNYWGWEIMSCAMQFEENLPLAMSLWYSQSLAWPRRAELRHASRIVLQVSF